MTKIFLRLAVTCALVAALTMTGWPSAVFAARDAKRAGEEPSAAVRPRAGRAGWQQLTYEESLEVREMMERFVGRFGETQDVAPAIEEMFAEGFEETLRATQDARAFEFVSRDVVARATRADLRRLFVAEFNFMTLSVMYRMEQARVRELSGAISPGVSSVWDDYPADVVAVLEDDPTYGLLREKFDSEERGASEGDEAGRAFDPRPVKTLAQMRRWAATMERASAALRRNAPGLAVLRALEREERSDDWDGYYTPDVYVLEEPEYGLPGGTRLVRARVQALLVLQFRLSLARVGGRMQIVSAETEIDGD
jgi:hypothetical protein